MNAAKRNKARGQTNAPGQMPLDVQQNVVCRAAQVVQAAHTMAAVQGEITLAGRTWTFHKLRKLREDLDRMAGEMSGK